MRRATQRARRWWLAIAWLALAWAMLLHGLGAFGLVGPDEPRYAAIAAAMLRSRDFITPRLWGRAWFEKPVLLYWLAALGDAARGVGAAGARLASALLAAGMSAALGWFLGRTHSRRAGWMAAFLSLTTVFVFGFGRAATTDMPLTAPFAAGMMALYLWWRRRRTRWLVLAVAALALATLAKGPVAVVLAGLALMGFAASQRRFREAFHTVTPVSVGVFLLVAAPWYLAAQWKNPTFFRKFFWQQNIERFATNRYLHPQPAWFYIPVLLLALAPWTGWLAVPVAAAWRRLRQRGWRQAWDGRDAPLKAYLGFWALAPVAFFSLSHSKLPSYILPSVPAAVALIAVFAAEHREAAPRWALALSAGLAGLVPAALLATPWLLAARAQRAALASPFAGPELWALLAAGELPMLWLALRRQPRALIAATSLLMAAGALALTTPPLSRVLDAALSARPLARALERQCGLDRPVRFSSNRAPDGRAMAGIRSPAGGARSAQGTTEPPPPGLPSACAGAPLYAWRLDRELRYGAEYELAGRLADWAPSDGTGAATVVLDRASLAAFQARYGRAWRIAPAPGFAPTTAPGVPPRWAVLQVQGRAAPPPLAAPGVR